METIIKLFYIFLICFSFITIFFAPFGLYFSSKCLKTVHFNLKFLILVLGLLWCILPLGGIYFYSILDAPENPPLLYSRTDYLIARNSVAITGYAIRIIEISISFERLLATVFFEMYERKKFFRIFPLVTIFVTFLISSSFSLLFNILHVPALVIYVFLITVETTNFILLYFLRKQNHKLRKMKNSVSAHLTSKYQLIENIKSINLLFPQSVISCIMANTALAVTISIREFYIEAISAPVFYTIYNLNVITVSLYWITRSPWYKRNSIKVQKFFLNGFNDSTEVMSLKATTVKTALGNTVNVQQTTEDYFKNLKNVWN